MPQNPAHRPRPRAPQLAVAWQRRRDHIGDDLRALLHGPWPRLPRRLRFHDPWRPPRSPAVVYAAAALAHAFGIFILLPLWLALVPRAVPRFTSDMELTWSGPIKDLPPLAPRPTRPRSSPARPRQETPSPVPAPAPAEPPRVDRFARQTIQSTPARPNHPRQTLLQPDAPPEAPRILPPLPNIVQWARQQPARPRMSISRDLLARLRPRQRSRRAMTDVAAPALPNQERALGALSISSNAPNIPRPRMPVAAASVPLVAQRRVTGEAAAPEIGPGTPGDGGGDDTARRLIALSADPAPPPPVLEIPAGNLAARVSLSPLGPQPGPANGGGSGGGAAGGNPGGASNGNGNGSGSGGAGSGPGAGGAGPPGIVISAGDPKNTTSVAGLSGGVPGGVAGSPAPAPAKAPPVLSRRDLGLGSPRVALPPPPRIGAPLGDFVPTTPEEAILRARRVYTMSVNLPNLTSVTGSWIVRFAELDAEGKTAGPSGDLAAPDALRKVDPRYPQALVEAKIEGDVILYAIIRKNGTVDSLQVLRSLEPELDRNAAEAFSRWQFRPAARLNGEAVDVEAIITIPFRAVTPR